MGQGPDGLTCVKATRSEWIEHCGQLEHLPVASLSTPSLRAGRCALLSASELVEAKGSAKLLSTGYCLLALTSRRPSHGAARGLSLSGKGSLVVGVFIVVGCVERRDEHLLTSDYPHLQL